MDKDDEFIDSVYYYADKQLNETYKKKKESRDELLKAIAMILLTYTIVDNVLSVSEKDYNKEYSLLSALIIKLTRGNIKQETNNTTNILRNTIKNTYKHYSYNNNLKDVNDIINANFKDKHFSDRIWENEQEVAKKLNKQCRDFLRGKINVNQIQSEIKKTYNTSAYNAKRLTETEVSRCHAGAFDRFCKETGVKKVKYVARRCKTCDRCLSYDGKIFDVDDKPDLPQHPLCQCYYKIAHDNEKSTLVMNLQLFGFDEKKELQKLISNGTINEEEYNNCYEYFNKKFKNGIITPIGTVYNKKDRFIHIARRHQDMISNTEIDNICKTLKYPDSIFKTEDKFNNKAIGYIKKIGKSELLVIENNGIITAYYPSKNYLEKIKRGEIIWQKEY